jgi:hypothetical protein
MSRTNFYKQLLRKQIKLYFALIEVKVKYLNQQKPKLTNNLSYDSIKYII